jgi:hypothetical protein
MSLAEAEQNGQSPFRRSHGLVQLDDAGYAKEAVDGRALTKAVAEFKEKLHQGRKSNPSITPDMA